MKYIWLTNATGIILYLFNYFYKNELADDLITFCDRILYLLIARIVVFILKLKLDSERMKQENFKKPKIPNEYPLSLKEA